MPRISPQEAAEKWSRRMQGATQDYQNGIARVTVAPGQKAAQNVQGYQNGVAQAVASGKWQRKVAAVSLQSWQESAATKGAQRLAAGAAAAAPKFQAAAEKVFPMIQAAQNEIASMPRATAQDRIARAVAFMTKMNQKAQGGGR